MVGVVALPVGVVVRLFGVEGAAIMGFFVFWCVPLLVFILHVNITPCLSAEEKAVWRRQLWWSHRYVFTVWPYLFASDLHDRTKGLAPYQRGM